jgi:hypothetical protein
LGFYLLREGIYDYNKVFRLVNEKVKQDTQNKEDTYRDDIDFELELIPEIKSALYNTNC